MQQLLIIRNAMIADEKRIFRGWLKVKGEYIEEVGEGNAPMEDPYESLDAGGKYLLPGVIDCHVHFREPGLTHKADLATESAAAVAGGVTSFMEMPNTKPQATTLEILEEKYRLASEKSLANYSFFLGATNDNIEEIAAADPQKICGVKVFFGASTGNMLVDKLATLDEIFRRSPLPVAAHCEDEATIRANSESMRETYGESVPVEMHPAIRSAEACYRSSSLAVELARKYATRLHLTHLSTAKEIGLLDAANTLPEKHITSEVCTHYLCFSSNDYSRFGTKLKVNPAIKSPTDQEALFSALNEGVIDILSTDHAPHLLSEKDASYFNAPSGTPMVQFSLPAMLDFWKQGKMDLSRIVEVMSHAPARCYNIEKRGYLRPGYYADMVLVDDSAPWTLRKEDILSKCGWSLFEGRQFQCRVLKTFVNGTLVYNAGQINAAIKGQRLVFNR